MKSLKIKKRVIACCKTILVAAVFASVVLTTLLCCKKSDDKPILSSPERICGFALDKMGKSPKMEKADAEMIGSVFGIELGELESYELWVSADASYANEVAVFKLGNDQYSEELKSLLSARLNRAAAVAQDYSPEQYDIIMKSSIEEKGEFIFYVVHEKSAEIITEIEKLIAE